MLLSVLEEGSRILREASKIKMPVLILSAEKDWVVDLSAEKSLFKELGSDKKEMVVYPGFFHEIFHEKEREKPISKAREFIEALFKD